MENYRSIHGEPARASSGCATCGNARQVHGMATCSSACGGPTEPTHGLAIGEDITLQGRTLLSSFKNMLRDCVAVDLYDQAVAEFVSEVRQMNVRSPDSFADSVVHRQSIRSLHPAFRQVFKPIRTTGNGDCFYNALSLLYFGDESRSDWFRLSIAQTISMHHDKFQLMLNDLYPGQERRLRKVLRDVVTKGEWATEFITLAATAVILKPITMLSDQIGKSPFKYADHIIPEILADIQSDPQYFGSSQIFNILSNPPPSNVYLMHVNGNHYVATSCSCDIELPFRDFQNIRLYPLVDFVINRSLAEPTSDSVNMLRDDMLEGKNSIVDEMKSISADTNDRSSSKKTDSTAAERMRRLRANPDYAEAERKKNRESKRKHRETKPDISASISSESTSTSHKEDDPFSEAVRQFKAAVSDGPSNVCFICHNLWFSHSIKHVKRKTFTKYGIGDVCDNHDSIIVCFTCNEKLRKGVIPKHSWINGPVFPEVPEVVKQLTPLEEILVSPRIPFMTIRPLGRDRQHGLKGAVVNVPIDVPQTLSSLPRRTNNTHLISVQLKRRMQYKTAYHRGNIRPSNVISAAKILTQKSLYKHHGIQFSSSWNAKRELSDDAKESKDWEEMSDLENEEEPVNPGGQETLLCSENDMVIAPGEGKIPLNLLFDEDCEELCFPSLFGGEKNPFKFMKPGERAKFMARHVDRRCSKIPYLFFLYKRLEMEKLNNIINICIRKRKKGKLTAKDCLNEEKMNSVFQEDEGYKFMKSLRSSPAYWESKKKDLYAMIRQLGFPTLFMTFSAAESKWTDLLVILKAIVDKETITKEDAGNLPYEERARLIRSDPITCTRYFENKFRNFLHKIILNEDGPFKEHPVKDHYVRFEFQHRGSVHAHMLLWLDKAPVYDRADPKSKALCRKLIDSLISCSNDESISDFIPYQTHKHSFTCRKSRNMQCRFGIPSMPMKATDILDPLDQPLPADDMKKMKRLKLSIKKGLNDKKYTDIDDMLSKHSLTYDEYLNMIRSHLKRPKVFLRRSVNECFINAYNKTMLTLFGANMDIQFIVDPYACASYIIDYINKSNRSMSLLMRNVMRQVNSQNLPVKKKFQTMASKFINATEISAQEAAYHILELPLSKSSRQVMYINTGRPDERVRMLKCTDELSKMDPECEEIFHNNIHDYYINRPDSLEDTCLADFAANYNIVRSMRSRVSGDDDGKFLPLKNKMGFIKLRSRPKIIRYRRYCEDQDPIEFYREQITLFSSWRDEENDILNRDIAELYNARAEMIAEKRSKYITSNFNEKEETDSVSDSDSASDEGEFGAYTKPKDIECHIGNDNGNKASGIPFKRITCSNDEFGNKVKSLNERQYKYALSIWRRMCEGLQVLDFVTGGAGTGKSKLIETLTLEIDRYFNIVSANPDGDFIRSIVCAPTGKAAFNIRGLTIHTAFGIPVTQNREAFCPLTADKLNTFRCRLHGLKFVIIDEISMVGAKLFQQIDNRLRQIFDPGKQFGGISVIVFGDFNQLKPVCDSYVFKGVVNNPYHAVAGDTIWRHFNFFELLEIMRQKDDVAFATALQHFAGCCLTYDDISLLRSRECSSAPEEAIHLFASNDEVDCHNQDVLSKLETFGVIAEARDTCYGSESLHVKEGYLKSLKNAKPTETCGFHSYVNLKISAKYMIIDNIDIEDGLVNGAIGKLVYLTMDNDNASAQIAWIQFEDPNVGVKARNRYKQDSPDCRKWAVPIFKVTKHISNKGYHKQLQIYRTQFPLIPAEAITIHKSQGSTYKYVAYHVGKFVSHASAYVALSRATSAEGLYIIGRLRTFTSPNSVVKEEIARLRGRLSCTEYDFMLSKYNLSLKVVSFNIQSLLPHLDILLRDPCMNNADVMCLLETWTVGNDVFDTGSYRIVSRIDSGVKRHPCGIVILAQEGVECESLNAIDISGNGYAINISVVLVQRNHYIITVYASPKAPHNVFKDAILQASAAIPVESRITMTGDFNMSPVTCDSLLRSVVVPRQVRRCPTSGPSTYLNTCIDHTFSNARCLTSYYDSFLSYHRPQVIMFPRQRSFIRRRPTRRFVRRLRGTKIKTQLLTKTHHTTSRIMRIYKYIHLHNPRSYLKELCRKRNRHKKKVAIT